MLPMLKKVLTLENHIKQFYWWIPRQHFQINYVVLLNMSLRQYMNLYRAVWHLNLLLTFWIDFFIKRKKTIFAPSSCHVRDWKYWWIPPGTMQTEQSLLTYGCYCWTEYHQELVWDAFINGLTFHEIWQHLLESQVQTLNQAYDITSALEHDQHNSKDCVMVSTQVNDALHTGKTFSILMAAMFCKWILLL